MITINLQQLLIYILLLVAIVALSVLCAVFLRLLPTLRSLARATENLAAMSETAKEDLDSVQGIISNVSSAASDISGIVAGNRSGLKAAANLVNAAAGLAGLKKSRK